MNSELLLHSPLGKNTPYPTQYDPGLLCAIPRKNTWQQYGYASPPWSGFDIWNAWEISWLNEHGLPKVAIGEFRVPATSPNLIESKSLKLYLNSLSQTKFNNADRLVKTLTADLSACADEAIRVNLFSVEQLQTGIQELDGTCLDSMDMNIAVYTRDATLLRNGDGSCVSEKLYSHLLKTNCPVTGQPDWGSIYLDYTGKPIAHESLLKYLISWRGQCDFHEQCTENIFLDIMQQCQPDELTVYSRYLRRGGLDINPYRSTKDDIPDNPRLIRQ